MNLSKRKLSNLKRAALAILAAAAPLGAAGAVAAATAATTTQVVSTGDAQRPMIAEGTAQSRQIGTTLRRMGVGPGVHVLRNRPLSGLEIRAVRIAASRRCIGTNRTSRSKYVGDGIPARFAKAGVKNL